MKANVLGTEYEIRIANTDTDSYLKDMDGYCDETTKTIVVDEMKPDDHSKLNLKEYQNKVTRHELIHAFLFESGLAESSPWARNEEMVDWIASQFPKIKKVFEDLKII